MKKGKLIAELAISKGTPLYNHNQKSACAAIYALAIDAIMINDADSMKPELVKMMKTNAKKAAHTCCVDSKAWAYRKVLDNYIDAANSSMAIR